MISLLRIRITYIKRHPCLLFWTYLFLPIIIFLFGLIRLLDIKLDFKYVEFQPAIANISEELLFFQNDNINSYSALRESLPYTIFVVDEENKCPEIQKFISDNTNEYVKEINCSTYEYITIKTKNVIKIKKEKNDRYRIYLDLRDTSFISFSQSQFLLKKNELNQDLAINAFSLKNITYENKNNYKTFLEIQSFLSKLLIQVYNNKDISSNFKVKLGLNPYPAHYKFSDDYDYGTYSFLSFMIVLEFSLIAYNFNLRMIDEKENKLNILLERQGISKFKYNVSWLITFYALFLFSIIGFFMVFLSFIKFHFFLLFINLILFTFTIFSVCIFFTTCINTTKTGTTAVKFYNFGSIFLGFVIVLSKSSKIAKIIFGFIPQINIYVCICCIFNLNNFKNLTWDLLWLKANKMSYMESIIMYLVSIIFYLGLSTIIESYRNSGLNFILYIKSIFTKVSREAISSSIIENENLIKPQPSFNTYHQELTPVNQQKKEQNQCLKIVNVSKNFDDLKAVDNFNGELFSDEIFCLLGHNGAGKSTLINMISGIFDPTVGDILLNGKSLVTDKSYLYNNIGLCQQENIFFDYLTVQEHLEYMCKIKGSKINLEEIQDLVNKIDLVQKQYALCNTLSGGQKRKLCIALALIGNSKIILLDEPTSGMDVMARRALWEFLKNYKKDKIILLTTHFLDEAEYLGDRIGIMSDGHFLCSGTSSFLKSKYPCGFNINLLVNSKIFNEDYKQQFYNGLLKYEPNAEIKVASRGIFSINILSNNQHIEEIFDFIEQNKNNFGFEDYTVSSTSLEDVFLKINNKANLNDLKYTNKEDISNEKIMNEIPRAAGFCSQLCAQIIRGLYPFYRNKVLFFFELLSGLGFVYIFIFFFSDFIINTTTTKINYIDVLEEHNIYFYEKNTKDFLKNSDTYDNLGKFITLKELKDDPNDDITQFMNNAYNQAFANIAKGAIYVNKVNSSFYDIYNTEVSTSINGYFYANTMLFVSAFLKEYYGIDATIFPEVIYHALTSEGKNSWDLFTNSSALIIVSLISVIGFVIFLGGLMFEKIKEKRTNIKHLLYLSGSNIFGYWIGFYIVDYLKLLFFTIFLILPIYYINGAATYFFFDMLAICLSSLSFIYFISFFCTKDDSGAKVLFFIFFGTILVTCLIFYLLGGDLLGEYLTAFFDPYTIRFFDVTPITSMIISFIRLIISYNLFKPIDDILDSFGIQYDDDYEIKEFGFVFCRPKKYLFGNYIMQLLDFIVYTLFLILAESGCLQKLIHNIQLSLFKQKDIVFSQEEASEEFMDNNNYLTPLINNSQTNSINIPVNYNYNNNIINTNPPLMNYNNNINNTNPPLMNYNNNINNNYLNTSSSKNPLQNPYVQNEINKVNSQIELSTKISGLTKTFFSCCGRRNVRAINNLYLGLEPNEKFGLLGFNGSGKTTTFRAITNEILTDSGSVSLFGFDIKTQFENIRTMIGYCPQINPLFDFMKVKEIIKFYSELKTCNVNVKDVCEKFGLSKYLETYTINLSGGNKRKLTFAIAMMNRPSLLLLDEPSTGVDPESRRIMWRNINELSNSGHKYNMILTTHSMEEAEVLCDTVSWFKAGNFIAKGNPEELKLKYSAGYKLHIKFDNNMVNNQNNVNLGSDLINETFNNVSSLIEGMNIYSTFILSNPAFEPYLRQLINVVQRIRDKTSRICLSLIGKDLSFELVISIIKERQKDLFVQVLNMKSIDNTIDELSISMQSLENILTSLN